uniref:Uncharacterized protein n=1 Tax=Anopheles albimanus TaxID=7167 RepID=A0A182FWY2_ANOAL
MNQNRANQRLATKNNLCRFSAVHV